MTAPTNYLGELRNLTADPTAQAAYAATLLAPSHPREVLAGALNVLIKRPTPEARAPLVALYDHLNANGPKRDAGAFLRSAIIDALRPIALPFDSPLLARAARTVERMPPFFRDEAAGLRAAALIALNEVDESLAGYHAVRLLIDEHTDQMSGQPAITAVRVLASQEQLLPLYLLAVQRAPIAQADVVSECLRNLTSLPPSLLDELIEVRNESSGSTVLVGLYDLLIHHRAGPQALSFLEAELVRLKDQDLYRYLLIALLSARQPQLNELVLRSGQLENDRRKVAILLESLPLFNIGPGAAELIRRLNRVARSR